MPPLLSLFTRLCLVTVLSASLFAVPVSAQPLPKSLIGPQARAVVMRGKEMTPACPVDWSVRVVTLHGGKQEGSQLIVLDNGKMQVTLIPTRGLGILRVQMGDLRLGWDSPVTEVVHPSFINPLARGGLGWLEGFNEWLCRCGLENSGQPGKDVIITNTGDKAEVDLTLHGKIANIPASEVELLVEPQAPYRLTIRARVEERMLFGPKLQLLTELSTEPGSAAFRLKDTVVNRGAQPQEYQLLYHCNFGKPLLEEGARLVAAIEHVTPFNDRAARDVRTYYQFAGPQPGYVEQVYLLRPKSDNNWRIVLLLQNKNQDRGVSMRYSAKELPYLTLWKNTGAVEDGYVIGIEPGTSYPNNRRVERAHHRVPKLRPGEGHSMSIDFALHESQGAMAPIAAEIAALPGETTVFGAPQKRE